MWNLQNFFSTLRLTAQLLGLGLQGAKNLGQLSVHCCRILTMTRYTQGGMVLQAYAITKGDLLIIGPFSYL